MADLTPQQHAELSHDLALAIGYAPESVTVHSSVGNVFVYGKWNPNYHAYWRTFDYRDPSIVVAMVKMLGEEYDTYFRPDGDGFWMADGRLIRIASGESFQEAVARAVIALKGK